MAKRAFTPLADELSERISPGALLFGASVPALVAPILVAHAAVVHDDNTPPAPEEDPGDLPPDNEPIIYPPTPESGPVGPGAAMIP